MSIRLFLLILFITNMNSNSWAGDYFVNHFEFVTKEKATQLLLTEDDFIRTLSPFDFDSRLQKQDGNLQELFNLIQSSIQQWTAEEMKLIRRVLDDIDDQIRKNGYKINLPETIYMVKTTAAEEGGAQAYTRDNYIVLNGSLVKPTTPGLQSLLTHEIFHILTRNNPKMKADMYQMIGFNIMSPLEFPKSLAAFRITNPDAPLTDAYTRLKTKDGDVDCTMILYSNKSYSGGSFFNYLNIGFLKLNVEEDISIAYENGEPVIYKMEEMIDFFDQVGKNTKYIIHPEEILADNFAYAILNKLDVPDAWLVQKIIDYLKK